ncbi:MAG TPA: hypothetical protein VFD59_00145 [Nocardioidaceae bacterium]|nr:hypothetical protein [Nocardioidaceae bacterium]
MSPRGNSRVTSCTPAEARARREQAKAFIDVAEMVLSEPATHTDPHVAAALAVLAAIAATDAICGLQLGRYSRGQDHDPAAALLETVDLPDHTLPTKLRRVLGSKDNVHYSPRLISKTAAQALVRQARVLVDAAERL